MKLIAKRWLCSLLACVLILGSLPVLVLAQETDETDYEETLEEVSSDYLAAPASSVIDSGTCGGKMTWVLTDDGVLTISGSGNMENFYGTADIPWYANRTMITSVVLADGVTSIGWSAFQDCSGLTSVSIPDSVTSIREYAFYRCSNLTAVSIPGGVTYVGSCAFDGCTSLSTVSFTGTMQQWMAMDCKFPAQCTDGTVLDWGSCEYGLSYILDGDGVLTITGSGYIRDFWNPSSAPWDAYRAQIKKISLSYGITQIGNFAFSNCTNLESVNIPNGVESIGQSAFYRCSSLKSISFPNTLQTIGSDAFTECTSLTAVRIPASVTAIGEAAFCHCTSLTEITFGHSYSSRLSIGTGAFSPYDDGSYGLPDPPIDLATTVYVPSKLDINPAIRSYPWAGVSGCSRSVTYVSMNTGVSVATGGAYRNEVAVGQSIPMTAEVNGVADTSVTWSVENGTGTATIRQDGVLTGLTPGAVTVYATAANGLEGSCTVNVLRYVEGITILLNGKENIRSLGVGETLQLSVQLTPENTTTSGVTWSVENGTGSASLKTYDSYSSALPGLTGVSAGTVTLTATAKDSKQVTASLELTVSDSIRTYAVTGGNLYYNAETGIITGRDSTVTDAPIPAVIDGVTITGIAPDAFAKKTSWGYDDNTTLTSVSIPNTVTEIGDCAFYCCSNLSSLRFAPGSRLTTIGKEAFYYCSSLVTLTIPNSVTHVGENAFYLGSSNLKYLTISGELDTSDWLSYWDETLESVTFTGSKIIGLPHRVEDGSHYVDDMPGRSAKAVILSDSVQSIEAHAFCDCYGLTQVTMGAGVTTIGDYAFHNCYGLTQVTMGAGVTTIGDHAFSGCHGLTQVTMGAGVTTIGDYAFYNCDGLTQVTVGDGVTTIGDYAFYNCDGLTQVTMGAGVTSIGDSAFRYCPSLTSVSIPVGVTSIGEYAFFSCSRLATVRFLGNGFMGSDNIFFYPVTAYYPRGNTTWTQAIRDSFGSEVTWVEADVEGASPFVDVPTNAYYFDAVQWAVENKITAGTSDITFSPDAPCTRAQAVSFLWRAAGRPTPTSSQMAFTDVALDSYYRTAVLWAVENKITSGTSTATFSPDATCTRGQIVSFLCRAFGEPGSTDTPFTDVPADAYYAGAVSWAVANGVTAGTGDGKFSPDADCTRGQIVSFLYRCRDKM